MYWRVFWNQLDCWGFTMAPDPNTFIMIIAFMRIAAEAGASLRIPTVMPAAHPVKHTITIVSDHTK